MGKAAVARGYKLTAKDLAWLKSRNAPTGADVEGGKDKGTPETRRNLTSDHLRKLLVSEKLTQDQYDAALDIGEALHRITAPVSLRISDPSREVFGRGDDYESARTARLVNRYLDWCDAMVARMRSCPRPQDKRRWQIGPVLDVCEGMTCYQVERERGLKSGSMIYRDDGGVWAGRLIDALNLYIVSPKRERPRQVAPAA